MSVIQLAGFTGIAPRYSETALQTNQATVANNVKLWSGEIRPWRKPTLDYTCVSSSIQTIYRLQGPSSSVWLEFTSDTDICYSPLSDSTSSRIYYSENGVCKKTNYSMATSGSSGAYPRNWYYMGTPAPTSTPSGTPSNTSNDSSDTQSVVYVYTYVSVFDGIEEESAPSPASDIITATYDDYSVSVVFNKDSGGNAISPVVPTDHLNITKIRLYRSLTGSETVLYEEVDEFPLNSTTHQLDASGTTTGQSPGRTWTNYTYVDTVTSSEMIKELDSNYYLEPPSGLKGLVSMPNGFLAGFKDNEVWFSEPYLPHAWPSTYMLTTDAPIIGLGVYGTTLVVCTSRYPYTISGTHPSSMTQERQPMFQPCVSKQSIAYDQYGVIYASPYGLVALAAGQMDVFTRGLITQDEWATYSPGSMRSVMYNNMYMCSYISDNGRKMLIFSRGDEPALVSYDIKAFALHVERGTGKLYCMIEEDVVSSGIIVSQRNIYLMDSDEIDYAPYKWTSKRFYFPYWINFSAMKVDADFESLTMQAQYIVEKARTTAYNTAISSARSGLSFGGSLNARAVNASGSYSFSFTNPITEVTSTQTFVISQGINGSLLKEVTSEAETLYVNVSGYRDGEEEPTFDEALTSSDIVRLPSGKAHAWQFSIRGTLNVRSVLIGTTLREVSSPA